LQTRPITTLTPLQYEECSYLDEVLPKNQKFFYEKTEISEIAPRPTTITYSILQEVYKQGGPIDKVYLKYGMSYKEQDFLTVVGNELYVNREHEIKTLLPSYSYLANAELKPKLHTLNGIFRTLKNIIKINSLKTNGNFLFQEVKEKLEYDIPSDEDFKTALNRFLNVYSLIFEINLLAEKVLKRFHFAVGKSGDDEALLLSLPNEEILGNIDLRDDLLGNSLEINDTTPFSSTVGNPSNQTAKEVFQRLSSWKQLQLGPLIRNAQDFNRLREYGRWLTVKNISNVRKRLLSIAEIQNFENPKNIYFCTVTQIQSNQLDEQIARDRKQKYQTFSKFNLPNVLTNILGLSSKNQLTGVSPGIAKGALVELSKIQSIREPVILYTKILSPDLVQYFPKVKGILSEKGGILSHLAIMAREHHIPVIVNFNLMQSTIKLGDQVLLNAHNGTVESIDHN
jgi:phosphohistidine swiveling domain-containing protein